MNLSKAIEALKICRSSIVFDPWTGRDIDPLHLSRNSRELYEGIELVLQHIQRLETENAQLSENIQWMEAERDDFKRYIRQLEAERDIAVKALIVTRDKVEQAHNILIDDIVHRVDDDTYLVLSNMVSGMLDWAVENEEHCEQKEQDHET